ncbi:uncharacterized protein LOC117502681 isoform X2 [Thalassophryne amazonica]|uniref:uncharacterized protein LOC117502681 isoform X2 n=1 Tax=Thalassophryne amazonica TaxID=390379 RepID=UPI001470A2B7|nr:uncharacterized protein LOC117502681 isoform X2 [Thalassophryne amazonica]
MTMDVSTIWQWRIKFVKIYSRHPEPFLYCDKIGLDFNVGSNKRKKLDLQLATNGAILEICEFAKTLYKYRYRFVSHILENSFDLGLENDQQRIEFSLKIGPKISPVKRRCYKYKIKPFNLASFLSDCKNDADNLNMVSSEHLNTDNVSLEIVVPNTDDSEHEEEFNSSQAPSEEYVKIEYVSDDMEGTHSDVSEADIDDCDHEEEFSSSQEPSEEYVKIEYVSDEMDGTHTDMSEPEPNTDDGEHEDYKSSQMPSNEDKMIDNVSEEMDADGKEHEDKSTYSGEPSEDLRDGALPLSFPLCEQIGMNFEVGSNQRLDPALVTGPVMLELARVCRILTGSFKSIVLAVLDHNFELDIKCQENHIVTKVKKLLKLYRKVAYIDSKLRTEFENAPFSISLKEHPSKKIRGSKLCNQSSPQYQFKELTKRRQSVLRRKREEMALFSTSDQCMNRNQNDGHYYTRPLGDSDGESDNDITSVKVDDQENCGSDENMMSVKKRARHSLSPNKGFPPIKSNVDSSESDSDKEQLFASRPQTPTQTNDDILTESDIEQGALGTDKLWKLRANRVKQILTMLDKDSFFMSKRFGLNYNVGFGLKQKLNIETMNQSALFEVVKFTLAMNSSQQDVIMEILEYNFYLELQGEQQRQVFASETMKRVRQLKNCDDVVKFSKETFELPNLESLKNQSAVGVKPELITVPMRPPDSHAEPEEHVSEGSDVLYPHCKEIGLKLHVNNNQANTKQKINKLTKGAMTEVSRFAEMLCGTFNQVLFDIIEHNFDVDLQSGHSEVAANILTQIAHIVDRRNLPIFKTLNTGLGKSCIQKCPHSDPSGVTGQECHSRSNAEECSAGTSKTPVTDQHVGDSADRKELNDYDKTMWKLRANHIRRMLTIPHLDECPLYSYSRCKKIGLEFNVGSGVEQNLDPNLLTNGVMAEVSAFATELQAAQKYFMTDILEYNFDIDLSNEQYYQVFAAVMFGTFKQLKRYPYKIPRLPLLFRLPFGKCRKVADSKSPSCPKCHQDRTCKLDENYSDPDHMQHQQTATETGLDPNSVSQNPEINPSSSFSTTEEERLQSYPRCKKIGLKLFVDKNKPEKKLDMELLTVETMIEVADFAKKLSGTQKYAIKFDLVSDILEHNFNIVIQNRKTLQAQFINVAKQYDGWAAWFNQVFVIRSHFRTQHVPAQKQPVVGGIRKSERSKEAEKVQLPLQQMVTAPVMTENSPAQRKKKNSKVRQLQPCNFPYCKKIGLDLDAKHILRMPKNKIKLNLLTRAVVYEIYTYAIRRVKSKPFSETLYEILDYNFDISSQHCRCWEFSQAVASKVQKTAKQFKNNPQRGEAVFKLPFVTEPSSSQNVGGQRKKKKVQGSVDKLGPRRNQRRGCNVNINQDSLLHGDQTDKDLFFHHHYDTTPVSQANIKYEPLH